jgi:hypothetical protein
MGDQISGGGCGTGLQRDEGRWKVFRQERAALRVRTAHDAFCTVKRGALGIRPSRLKATSKHQGRLDIAFQSAVETAERRATDEPLATRPLDRALRRFAQPPWLLQPWTSSR